MLKPITPGEFFGLLFFAVMVFGLIKLNLWYRAELKAMTPEERKKHDEEMAEEARTW